MHPEHLLLPAMAVLLMTAPIQAREPSMTIDAARTGAPIHPYVYGQFTELLFNLFEKGVWAEMLSDRKFFYPVDSSETLIPENRKRNFERWRPVGPDASVRMDRGDPYVGTHAPTVALEGDAPRGVTQGGLALRTGRAYVGRIALAGAPEAKVEVRLAWGELPGQVQAVSLPAPREAYQTLAFEFTAGGDTDQGRLEILGTGTGWFRIGVVSLMPADHVEGFRADMVALLRELKSGIYRWPGGNFVSGYNWLDGVGDRDRRPPRYDYAWRTVEYNDVGTDEFLALCRLLEIDPYLCVNSGLGDARSAAGWVEYVNGAADTPMGRLRAAHGHPEPYRVTWWGIGNEMYGEWQLGHMSIDHYVLKHNLFAEAMREVDPSIKLVASGATPFETGTTVRHHRPPLPAKLPFEIGSRQDWSGRLLARSSDHFDYLAEHLYPMTDHAFDVYGQEFVRVDDPLVDQVRRLPNRVRCAVEAWEEYLRRLPELKDKGITLAIDEWAGGGREGYTRTLCTAEGLHEMFRHSGIITMGAYTAFTANLAFNGAESTYSTVGLVFHLYRNHFGTIPVAVDGNRPQQPVKGTVGVDKPARTSGSDTYPLDVVAALGETGTTLAVAVVNPTASSQAIRAEFLNVDLSGAGTKREIAAPDIAAQNVAGEEPVVRLQESSFDEVPDVLQLAPLSVTLYTLEIRP